MRPRRFIVTLLVLFLVPASAFAGGAPVALYKPTKQLCVNDAIRVGVRSTGVVYDHLPRANQRWFSVRIVDPQGRRVFLRRGIAPRAWRMWSYEPSRAGVYRTRYYTAALVATFSTRVDVC